MKVIVSDARVVSKDTHTFQNGDTVYRLQIGNGEGGLALVSCDKDTYDVVVPYEDKYDAEINVSTVGYKTYMDVVGLYKA